VQGDLQAYLYAFDTMNELEVDRVWCRWVYFETDRKRQAEPRDFVVTRSNALNVIESAAEIAKELDAIDHIDQAPMNPDACPDFGGCEFHVKAGGPCSASVPVGRLIQARVPKKGSESMPLNKAGLAAAGAALQNRTTTPAPVEAPTTTEAVANPHAQSTTVQPAPEQTATVSNPETGTTRQTRRTSKAAAAGSFAQLAQELSEAEAELEAANVKLEAAKATMRKALG
jgi:hypothetical protein